MLRNYNQYIKENLLDKLKGPNKEEIEKNLKNQYKSNKIDMIDYYHKSRELNVNGPTINEVLDEIMNKYNKETKYYNNQSFFIRLAIFSDNFFNYIDFILLLIKNTSWSLGYDIIEYSIFYNKLDVLKYTLENDLYKKNNDIKTRLLKQKLSSYRSHMNDEIKNYINNYIKKLEYIK